MISYRMVAERELAARLIEEPLYIGGSWRAAGGAPIFVVDPTSEDLLAEVPSATAADSRAALQSAREAQPAWARTSTIERGAHLRAIADLLAANRDSLADLLVSEVGKPASQAAGELEFTESLVRYNAEWDRRLEGDILPGDVAGEVIHLLRAPVGVVAAICPWNFPLAVLARKLAPALLTGNTVVVKPSEVTPLSTIELFKLIDEQLELPPGVINLLTGGPATGAALVSDELTSMVSFTGHRDTGKAIMAAAAANLTRVALELGGKAPAIVWRDADLDLAIPALVSARHHNSGQVCTCAERVLVHHELLDTFTKRYVGAVEALRLGDSKGAVDMGPLVSAAQLAKTYINRTLGESVHAHHSGYGESGIGGEDGKWGLLRYTQIKTAYHHYGDD
jgi:lactaldehyde dehydrogenase/glycolaldehyde dehydrogenase